jgi:AmiR/NasT family two-component response regulator
MQEQETIVVCHDQPEVCEAVIAAASQLGYTTRRVAADNLVDTVLNDPSFALIACGMKAEGVDMVTQLKKIAALKEIPAIVVTSESSILAIEKALEDHVMAYLLEPVRAVEIRPTIQLVMQRFAEFKELKQEVADIRQQMAARRVVDRAKGVLMRRNNIDEKMAYDQLRRLAMDKRVKVIEIAQQILAAEEKRAG